MKATFVSVVLLIVSAAALPAALSAQGDPGEPPQSVRLLDGPASEAYALGAEASPAFRQLVDALEAHAVVVHVITGRPRIFGAVGATRLVGRAGGRLYLRVDLDSRVRLDERAAVLAHEFRHVLEIAEAAAVTDDDLRRLYERIGRHADGTLYAYETAAAETEGVKVLREIRWFASQTLRAVRAEAQQRDAGR